MKALTVCSLVSRTIMRNAPLAARQIQIKMKALTVCSLVSRTIMRNAPLAARQIQLQSIATSQKASISLSTTSKKASCLDDTLEAISPNQHDMMLTDINEKGLKELGDATGIGNLSKAEFPLKAFPVEGVIYGPNNRLMVNLVCRRSNSDNSVRVWFIVDTGSNWTFLAKNTIDVLIGPGNPVPECIFVEVQDSDRVIECHITPRPGHFEEANVLGMEALRTLQITEIKDINWIKRTFRLSRN